MDKCNITKSGIKDIRSIVATALYNANKSGSSITDSTIEAFKKVNEKYSNISSDEVIQAILTVATKYGVAFQNPDFFNEQNIKNTLEAIENGVSFQDPLTASSEHLIDQQVVNRRVDSSNRFLYNNFGTAIEVQNSFVNQTNKELVDTLFINRGSITNENLGLVNPDSINSNIREYQEILFQRVCKYLKTVVDSSEKVTFSEEIKNILDNPKLYTTSGSRVTPTNALSVLKNLIDTYLTNFSESTLRLLYNTIYNTNTSYSQKEAAKEKLEAYNARVLLQNFDSYLISVLGTKTLQVSNFNILTGEDKYKLADKNNKLLTSFPTEDAVDPQKETNDIVKLIVTTTPIRSWRDDQIIDNQYLTLQDVFYTVNSIKKLMLGDFNILFNEDFFANNKQLSESLSQETKNILLNNTLKQIIAKIRINSKQVPSAIFELFTNEHFYNAYYSKLFSTKTPDELNKLWSVSKGFFNGDYSLYQLTKNQAGKNYYNYIFESINSVFPVTFLQYYQDEEGNIKSRSLINFTQKQLENTIQRNIEIPNSNRFISNYIEYLDLLHLQETPHEDGSITLTYTIPNTDYKVTVYSSSGNVQVTQNGRIVSYSSIYDNANVKEYLDDLLQLGITSNITFETIYQNIVKGRESLAKSLIELAARVELDKFVAQTLKANSAKTVIQKIATIFGRNAPSYNYKLNQLGLIHKSDTGTIKNLSIALASYQGVFTSAYQKDGNNNSQSSNSQSRLCSVFPVQWELQEKAQDSASRDFLILTNPDLVENVIVSEEFYNPTTKSLKTTDMSIAEMIYSSFMLDYISAFSEGVDSNNFTKDGHALFLTSCNSDKTIITKILVNLNALVNGKPLKDFTADELLNLINKEFGNFYSNIYNNIQSDWRVIEEFARDKYGYDLKKSLSNGMREKYKKFNSIAAELGFTPKGLVKKLVREYNQEHILNSIQIVDQLYFKEDGDNITSNITLLQQIKRFQGNDSEYWENNQKLAVISLLKNNTVFNLSNSTQSQYQYLQKTYPDWVDNSGNLILAKIKGQKVSQLIDLLKIYNSLDTQKIIQEAEFEINPVIEKFIYLHYLVTQEYMNTTVGSFISHPAKSNNPFTAEAQEFLAQQKRNVSQTAQLHQLTLNLLDGVNQEYTIAVIGDLYALQSTINGRVNEVTIMDGATFSNPFIVYLENNSLGGASAGMIKKPFYHFKNQRTGTGGIIKTASFPITNDNIRNSELYQNIMRKMTDRKWFDQNGEVYQADISTDYNGNKINYGETFFFRDGKFYRMVGEITPTIQQVETADGSIITITTFNRQLQEVNAEGNPISEIFTESEIPITSNYELWQFFGGANSMELVNGKLAFSENSIKQVVTAMNNIGIKISPSTSIETQNDLWQPLKRANIDLLVTAGAIKHGAANINPSERFYDNESLDIQKITILQAGIQLDKEHKADQEDISLMTQTISACASMGFTYKRAQRVYEALRNFTEMQIQKYSTAVENVLRDPTDQKAVQSLKGVVIQTIIDNISNQSSSNNFIQSITQDVIRRIKNEEKVDFSQVLLPLSDNTIFNKISSIVTSVLTDAGIRQDIPGVLAILTPSHEAYKIYNGHLLGFYQNPQEMLQLAMDQNPPVYDSSDPNSSITNIELGRTYKITYNDGSVNNEVQILTPLDYYDLKEQESEGFISKIEENLLVGRNLAGYNVRFKDTEGNSYQLWDLQSAYNLFRLNGIKGLPTEQKLQAFNQFYSEFTNSPTKVSKNTLVTAIKDLEKILRKQLQNDLNNLNKEEANSSIWFQTLISSRVDTPQWYDRFTREVNIKLGNSNGNRLQINNSLVTINSDNINLAIQEVQNILNNKAKIQIHNGSTITVDKKSVTINPYEIIMPKTFKTKFGFNDYTDLEAVKNDPDWFLKRLIQNASVSVEPSNYDIALKNSNGKHYYIINRDKVLPSLTKKSIVEDFDSQGRRYRTDGFESILYEMQKGDDVFVDNQGNEVIVTNNPNFYINTLSYSLIQLSSNLSDQEFITYTNFLQESNNKIAETYSRQLLKQGEDASNIKLQNQLLNRYNLKNYQSLSEDNPLITMGRNIYNSFVRSLDIVATRIPSQSQQSFMPMKVVAYTNTDTNQALVSAYQILLQGSDYDIDTVSLATYDIDNTGILNLWSPYTNITNQELMEASFNLPFPTGKELELQESEKIEDIIYREEFFKKYSYLFSLDANNNLKLYLKTPESLALLSEFLQDVNKLTKPIASDINAFIAFLQDSGIVGINFTNVEDVNKLFIQIKRIVNNHNLYLRRVGSIKEKQILHNYLQYNLYQVIINPVNLIEAQTSVDATTGPFEDYGNKKQDPLALLRTAGNPFNLWESIQDNMVGKDCIGICAVALKSFFASTQYNNKILRSSNADKQQRLLSKDPIVIGDKVYALLANIFTNNPSTITNDQVLKMLSENQIDEDCAVLLSALLSLSTDNAKKLSLAKLQANTATLGLYLYGIVMGIDFKVIGDILTSDLGVEIINTLKGNVFYGIKGNTRFNKALDDFGNTKILFNYNIKHSPTGESIINPLSLLSEKLKQRYPKEEVSSPYETIANFIKSDQLFSDKLSLLESFRMSKRDYQSQIFNQLIDECEKIAYRNQLINSNQQGFKLLTQLSKGAEEMRILGQILGANQGLKSSNSDFLQQVNNFEQEGFTDIQKFIFGSQEYREDIVNNYEKDKKVSVNIYDVINNVPHFFGYIKSMATALTMLEQSNKFKSLRKITRSLPENAGFIDNRQLISGIVNFLGDLHLNLFLRNKTIVIPKDNIAFDESGNSYTLKEDTPIRLGTDYSNATLKAFLEKTVIPNLKKGIVTPGKIFSVVSDNKFIKDLKLDLLTSTVSRNPAIVYNLPIDMLPKTDNSRKVFNDYKQQFDKLNYSYLYSVTTYDQEGNKQVPSNQLIPLTDIFTYYAMVADRWKLGEKSLVSILEDFQNTGLIKEFHEFEVALDSSPALEILKDFTFQDLLPYIVQLDNPRTSFQNYIRHRNKNGEYIIMKRKVSRKATDIEDDVDPIVDDILEEESQSNNSRYTQYGYSLDTNYFQTGNIKSTIKREIANFVNETGNHTLSISYDINTKIPTSITYDNTTVIYTKDLIFKKVNGEMQIDFDTMIDIIENEINPC